MIYSGQALTTRDHIVMCDDFDLPCMGEKEEFFFSCGPEQPCFNRCCSQLALPLTPYDVLRLSYSLELTAQEFLKVFASLRRDAETGFPDFQLRMIESPDAPCPFVTPAGCAVYADRPGACRAYPLGRGAKLDKNGVCQRFFVIREEHCCGFGHGTKQTPAQWLENQGMARYIYFNDRYMRLLSMVKASGSPVNSRLGAMIDLSLWQMDAFAQLIEKTGLLNQITGEEAENPKLLERNMEGGEARLELGLSWLELLLFGKAEHLQRKI